MEQLRGGSGYDSSSGDSASLATDYDPFAPPTRAKALPEHRLHPSLQSMSSLERVIGIDRPISPTARLQAATPPPFVDADMRRRLHAEAQPGFPYRGSAHLMDAPGHQASASESSANSSDEVDLDLTGDLVAAGIAPPWPTESEGQPRHEEEPRRSSVSQVRTAEARIGRVDWDDPRELEAGFDGAAGWSYNATAYADAHLQRTPELGRRRNSRPLRVLLDRAFAGLPSPPWSATTATASAWPLERRGSQDADSSPQTVSTASPRTPAHLFDSPHVLLQSPPLSPPMSEPDKAASRFGFASMFRGKSAQHGLGMHIPQVEIIAPAADEEHRPIRSHSPAPSSGRASPTPGSPLLSPVSSPPQPAQVRFVGGHGKPIRSLFQDEAPVAEDVKGKNVEREKSSGYRPLRLVEAQSQASTPARSRDASALQADTSGSTSGAFTMTTSTQRSVSDLIQKVADRSVPEVAAWPGAATLDVAGKAPPLPAKVLFWSGCLFPCLWIIGGWCVRSDGELYGTRGAFCRCRYDLSHDHAPSISLVFDHDPPTTRPPTCAAERLRQLRLSGHDVQYSTTGLGHNDTLDPYVRACRVASIASGAAVVGITTAAIFFAAS